ncbi:helix-turn-helix domain-containing protein [Limosilactobacillus caecicola]|uniref:helix-turn-helix domain-containing protein n=1 Tax=Limosilactobacillus caecicola TaxID=2941332 RepID=UPI002041F048|nr:helix-turn-helix domain-containing protein [Limosilactobacillus caecicola]
MEYITEGLSSYSLERKYNISARLIRKWIQQYQLQGIKSFKQRHRKRVFSAKFKWHVIDYYQTHAEPYAQVAAKFDLLPSQIAGWRHAFIKYGYDALKPHRKGRPSKVKKQTKKQKQKLVEKKEIDQLREELARTKQELYNTKIDRDILKNHWPCSDPQSPKENTNSGSDQGRTSRIT